LCVVLAVLSCCDVLTNQGIYKIDPVQQ
jgi:hypothetical protein